MDLVELDSETRSVAEMADVIERIFVLSAVNNVNVLLKVARYLEFAPRIRDVLNEEPHEVQLLKDLIKFLEAEARATYRRKEHESRD